MDLPEPRGTEYASMSQWQVEAIQHRRFFRVGGCSIDVSECSDSK